jgi:heparosan-N-sulfate-glucuronate 5-epimerase
MSGQLGRQFLWRVLSSIGSLPIIRFFISEWQVWRKEREEPPFGLAPIPHDTSELPPYPLDMWFPLALPHGTLDKVGVPYNAPTSTYPASYHPTTIAQYALANWNAYLATRHEKYREAFMIQARWLVDHESHLADDAGGWPIPFAVRDYYAPKQWLSALTQGHGISVLVRAYRLTDEDVFLQVARRAIRTFELDIQEGGVSTSIGDDGVFFEEVAVYPAAHILNGYLLGLFGLYDYVALTGDIQITAIIRRSLATLHTLIDGFDTGYWSRYDLLFKHLTSRYYHTLHVMLLEILAQSSGCDHCAALASRWDRYQRSLRCRLRYFIVSRIVRYHHGFRRRFSHAFDTRRKTTHQNVCAPIAASPVEHPRSVDREVHR